MHFQRYKGKKIQGRHRPKAVEKKREGGGGRVETIHFAQNFDEKYVSKYDIFLIFAKI